MATPIVPISNAETAMRQLLEKLPMDQVLAFRERTKKIHYRQLEMIGEVLAAKGYVEPHHEGLLEHGRD
jgi:hypothetical protein